MSFAGICRAPLSSSLAFVLCSGVALAGSKPEIRTLKTGPIAVDATVIRTFQRFEGERAPVIEQADVSRRLGSDLALAEFRRLVGSRPR